MCHWRSLSLKSLSPFTICFPPLVVSHLFFLTLFFFVYSYFSFLNFVSSSQFFTWFCQLVEQSHIAFFSVSSVFFGVSLCYQWGVKISSQFSPIFDSNSPLRGNLPRFSNQVRAHKGRGSIVSRLPRLNLNSLSTCAKCSVLEQFFYFFVVQHMRSCLVLLSGVCAPSSFWHGARLLF